MCITTTDIDANANAKLMPMDADYNFEMRLHLFQNGRFISTLEKQTIIKRADISIRRA